MEGGQRKLPISDLGWGWCACFFFSSRRRHTRSDRDWSSDVCSSDLVTFIGGFVLLSGVLILVGSIAMTKFQRVYEAAVLKTLGARRRVLLTMMIAEYCLLGLVAGIVGALAADALAYAVAREVFEIDWTFSTADNLAGV